jgi:thymidine kinase
MAEKSFSKGRLEVVCGSMFSGKSEELIRRLKRAEYAQLRVLAFKHSLDDRSTIEYVTSHNGNKLKAIPTDSPEEIRHLCSSEVEVVGIDEVQFFPESIISIICHLVEEGKRVIVGGLDLDFKGSPFGPMPKIMAIADDVTKLKAICMLCGGDAHFTQRLVNNKPARHDDPIIVIGAEEQYQARCRNCHQIDRMPIKELL